MSKRPTNRRLQVFSALNRPIVEVVSVTAVFLSSGLVALDTLQDLPTPAYLAIHDALLALNTLFCLDFGLRWYAAGQFKLLYLTKPLVVLDIICIILPFVASSAIGPILSLFLQTQDNLPADIGIGGDTLLVFLMGLQNSAGLQNLLLLRVLRLRRVLTDINTFGKFEVALGLKPKDVRPYQLQLARVLVSIFTLLSVASGLIYTAEHHVNPDIPDYFAALYFTLTTLTTVGFGDIAPMTSQGRLIVSGSILAGVAIIPAQAASLVDVFIESGKQLEEVGKFRRQQSFAGARHNNNNSKRRKDGATDGKGPTGVPMELVGDAIDRSETVSLSKDKNAAGAVVIVGGDEDTTRICGQCGTSSHRVEASFCWSCGSEL